MALTTTAPKRLTPTMKYAASHYALRIAIPAYLILWAALARHPSDREAWLLENALVAALFIVLWGVRRLFRFSDLSLLLILSFLALHTLGSHYTYSEVPYDE